MNPREQKRMMQRMGMNMDSVARRSTSHHSNSSKDIVIDEPEVAILQVQGQKMYQVIGGQVSSKPHHNANLAAATSQPFLKKT